MLLETPAGRVVATPGPHKGNISLTDATAAAPESKPRWSQRVVSRLYGLAMTRSALVLTGTREPRESGRPVTASVSALSVQDGSVLWQQPLPTHPVSWGVAVDRAGRILVTLQDGQVLCYGEK